VLACAEKAQNVCGRCGARCPNLGAVHQPASVDLDGPAPQCCQIRSRVGFTHADGKGHVPAGDPGQEEFLLRVGAVLGDAGSRLAVADPVVTNRCTDGEQFFDNDESFNGGAPATIGRRQCHPKPAALTEVAGELGVSSADHSQALGVGALG